MMARHFRRSYPALTAILIAGLATWGLSAPVSAVGPVGDVTVTAVPGVSGQELTQITSGPDGNLWFTERYENAVVKMTPNGEMTKYTEGITANAWPTSLTTGPDGNIWFAEPNVFVNGKYQVGRITPNGVVTEFASPIQPPSALQSIVSGPDNSIWYVQSLGRNIAKMTMQGEVTTFPTGMPFGTFLQSLAVGPDGNVWFTGINRIGKMTPAGVVTTFTTGLTTAGVISGIAAGPDGNMWIAMPSVNQIAKVDMAGNVTPYSAGITVGASPVGIVVGADGNLWFTGGGSGTVPQVDSSIGRITTAGVVTEFPFGPYASNDPSGIVAGSDGNIWAVNILEASIVRARTGEAAPSSDPVVTNIKQTSANVSGIVYPGAATSAVTLQCARDQLFQDIEYSALASTGSPATGTTAADVAGVCSGLTADTNYFTRFVSSNTFTGSSTSSLTYTTIAPFTTSVREPQSLRSGTVPKRFKNVGKTVVNKRNATTKQNIALKARVVVKQAQVGSRGDYGCARVTYGPKRKVIVRTTGECALRIKVIYTAPGNPEYLPLKKAFTFKTKRIR